MSLGRQDGVFRAQVEWLTLDERREQDATGGEKLKIGRDISLNTRRSWVMVSISLLGDKVI